MSRAGDEHAERFTHLRPLLFTIAYEILGTATESDDVLQESYLRWAEVDLRRRAGHQGLPRPARHPAGAQRAARPGPPARGVRRTVAARTAARRRRRRVVGRRARRIGVDGDDGGAGDAEPRRAGGVRAARGVRLRPRRDRLDDRQVHARRCVRWRTAPASTCSPGASGSSRSTRKQSLELTAQFFATAATGDVDALITMLAPDVVWTADSDGKASAARRPVAGARTRRPAHPRPAALRRRRGPRRARLLQRRARPGALPRRQPGGRHLRRDHRRHDHATSTRCATPRSSAASRSPGRSSR